jgi:hypothetical protein
MKKKQSKQSQPLQFLARAQKDRKLNDRILAAVERGGKVTAEEVLQIAREFGFNFTRSEFEKAVLHDVEERFAAGATSPEAVAAKPKKPKPKPKPPESSCAKGCLSYTVSWHPSNFLE